MITFWGYVNLITILRWKCKSGEVDIWYFQDLNFNWWELCHWPRSPGVSWSQAKLSHNHALLSLHWRIGSVTADSDSDWLPPPPPTTDSDSSGQTRILAPILVHVTPRHSHKLHRDQTSHTVIIHQPPSSSRPHHQPLLSSWPPPVISRRWWLTLSAHLATVSSRSFNVNVILHSPLPASSHEHRISF